MTSQHLFEVGSKLMGVYFIVMSISTLPWVMASSWPVNLDQLGAGAGGLFNVVIVVTLLLMGSFGWLLLKRSELVRRIAFPEPEELRLSDMEELFSVGVKLFGALVAGRELFSFASVLSNYIFVASSQYSSAAHSAEAIGLATNFLPSLMTILFGVLLFFRGELLARWAFAERRDVENSD